MIIHNILYTLLVNVFDRYTVFGIVSIMTPARGWLMASQEKHQPAPPEQRSKPVGFYGFPKCIQLYP